MCGKPFPAAPEEPNDAEPDNDGDDMQESMKKPLSLIDSVSAVPTITESVVDGATVHSGRLLISVADRVNRNNRVYPKSVWQREAAASLEKARLGKLTGQAEHPAGRPELLDTFIKFTGVEYDEATGSVYAPFVVIPTAKGRDFAEIVKAGVAVGCSTRGTGSVKREKRGSTEVSVIQGDYNLEGIDVMLFGEQSVPSARLMQFEHIETTTATPVAAETTELHMPEVKIETLDALREAYPTLLSEAESPLNTKLTETEGKLVEANQANETLTLQFNEAKQELDALREANNQMTAQVAEAAQKLAEATQKIEEASNKHAALVHLTEVAREHKQAAWLVVEFLKDSPTPQAVDENMAAAVKKAESLIETTLLTGAGVAVAQPSDNETKPDDASPVRFPNALSLATGTRIR